MTAKPRPSGPQHRGVGQCGEHEGIGQHAVDELHRQRVLEQVAPPRLHDPEPGGNDRAVDQRPGVVAHAGAKPRDEAARRDLHQDEPEQRQRHLAGARRRHPAPLPADPQRHPDDGREDHDGKRQMRRQPVLADRDPVDQAAHHHVPAEHPLRRPERQQRQQPGRQHPVDPAGGPEAQERDHEGQPDHPPEQPVAPFPPVDHLELGEAHAGVDEAVLRDLPVFLELRQPLRLVQRRQRAEHRLPLGDRQAGLGEPRGAADDHDGDHQGGDREQPQADGELGVDPAAAGLQRCVHGR
jgi:hypothetical protein